LIVKRHDLKKKVKVTFAGEPGLDWGGLTKEWFLLLVRKIFQPDFGECCQDPYMVGPLPRGVPAQGM